MEPPGLATNNKSGNSPAELCQRNIRSTGATAEEQKMDNTCNETHAVWQELQRSAAAASATAAAVDLQAVEQPRNATAAGAVSNASLTEAANASNAFPFWQQFNNNNNNNIGAPDLTALLLLRAQQQQQQQVNSQFELQARLRALQDNSTAPPTEAALLAQLAEAERLRVQAEQQLQLRRTIEQALQHQRRLEGLASISVGLTPLAALALLQQRENEPATTGDGAAATNAATSNNNTTNNSNNTSREYEQLMARSLAGGAGRDEFLQRVLLGQQADPPQPPEDPPAAAKDDDDAPPRPNAPAVLPPVEEGATPHYSERRCFPLGIDEDVNWLSERQCFIRAELLEVVQASHQEVLIRSSSKSVAYQQTGIRCKYCAHMHPDARAIRSSAYPSSIRQIYQSFTMMVRDHFGQCPGIPQDKKQRFLDLKGQTSPSSSLSRQYWMYAAERIGMIDTEYGIIITPQTQAAAASKPLFGTKVDAKLKKYAPNKLIDPTADRASMSSFLFAILDHVEQVFLLPSEQVGKRKAAPVGLMGFGCRYCNRAGRLGFCRVFPLNKRSLPTKVEDMYKHMKRCTLCPAAVKQQVAAAYQQEFGGDASVNSKKALTFPDKDRDFMDQVWKRLGREGDVCSSG